MLKAATVISLLLPAAAGFDADAVARAGQAASRFMAIARICPPHIPTDASKASRFASIFMATGKKAAGEDWDAIVRDEVERRLAEVEITGERRWCEDQRRYLRDLKEQSIFPQAR